jgi:hypothetical protein
MGIKFNPLGSPFDLDSGKTKAIDLSKIAGQNISALKVIFGSSATNVLLANSNNDEQVLGVALNAANNGDLVLVRTFGELADPSFLFAPNEPLFFNNFGTITAAPPSSGFSTQIGHGLGAGKIFIKIGPQIVIT